MDLLVPADHPLAARDAAALAEAADQPWIVGAAPSSYHQLTLVACAAAGFAPATAHTAKEWISVPALVAHGLGVALAPRLGHIPPYPPAVRVRLRGEPAPFRRILTCVRRGSREQPAISRALHILGDIAAIHWQQHLLARHFLDSGLIGSTRHWPALLSSPVHVLLTRCAGCCSDLTLYERDVTPLRRASMTPLSRREALG